MFAPSHELYQRDGVGDQIPSFPQLTLFLRPYLSYFDLDGQDGGGGVGTTTGLIFGMVGTVPWTLFL
jgi:hypothetical protein